MSRSDFACCPVCHSEVPIAWFFSNEEAQRAFTRLAAISIPLGPRVMRYLTLFTPPKTRLTQGKQLKLIEQLVPDMKRQAITYDGRDIAVPLDLWNQAFEKLFAVADAGRLTLPLSGHNYLYSTLRDLAAKAESAAEAQAEHAKRVAPRRDTVQVRGQTMSIGDAMQVVYGGKDPALVDLERRSREASQPSDAVREEIARITGRTKPTT